MTCMSNFYKLNYAAHIYDDNEDTEISKCTEYAKNILIQMHDIYISRQLCDVVLIADIDGKRIHAHRFLLSACSPYFLTMFTSSLRESRDHEITLHVRGEILEKLIDYCYTGHIELCDNTVEDLLATADLWQLHEVVEICADYLIQQLHASNCLGFMYFAEERNCQKLFEKSSIYTSANFMALCKSEEFLKLSFQQLCDLITRDDLYVNAEEIVFHNVTAWINHDIDERDRYYSQLMQLVRFPFLEASSIREHVKHFYMRHKYAKLLAETDEQALEEWKPRSHNRLIVAVSQTDVYNTGYMQLYSPKYDKWIKWNNKPSEMRYLYDIAAMDDKLFFIGICNQQQVCVFTYNLIDCKWTKSATMKTYRMNFSAAVVGNYLYVVGGMCNNNLPVNIVERWDINKNNWSYIEGMPSERYNTSIAVMDDSLYVVGGYNDNGICNIVECYNTHTNTWSNKAQMVNDGMDPTIGVRDGFLYAFGTTNGNRTYFERYDKQLDQWTVIFQAIMDLRRLSCILYENKFLLIDNSGQFYAFDPVKITFQYKAPLLHTTSKLSSVIIPNIVPHLF